MELIAEQVVSQDQSTIIATVLGKPYTQIPKDLYIPPDALRICLTEFSGPLDLLLYLIKRGNFDILTVPVAEITRQYMEYIDLMQGMQLDLAAEYLLMAAFLGEIKSRSLLPKIPSLENEDETDPRQRLIQQLQEYERFKSVAEGLEQLPTVGKNVLVVALEFDEQQKQALSNQNTVSLIPDVNMNDLLNSLRNCLIRADQAARTYTVLQESLSVRDRMTDIINQLPNDKFISLDQLYLLPQGVRGVVVTFLAILELVKDSVILLVQNQSFAPIYIGREGAVMSNNTANQQVAEKIDQCY